MPHYDLWFKASVNVNSWCTEICVAFKSLSHLWDSKGKDKIVKLPTELFLLLEINLLFLNNNLRLQAVHKNYVFKSNIAFWNRHLLSVSNLWSLHRQYKQLFRYTVKDLRGKRIPLQHLPWGIFYFNMAGPCVAKTHAEASHLLSCTGSLSNFITTVLRLCPWLSEKSAWCKHC